MSLVLCKDYDDSSLLDVEGDIFAAMAEDPDLIHNPDGYVEGTFRITVEYLPPEP